jgi:hypothetical protein
MLAGATQEEMSDGAYSRINPPYSMMTRTAAAKADLMRPPAQLDPGRIADFEAPKYTTAPAQVHDEMTLERQVFWCRTLFASIRVQVGGADPRASQSAPRMGDLEARQRAITRNCISGRCPASPRLFRPTVDYETPLSRKLIDFDAEERDPRGLSLDVSTIRRRTKTRFRGDREDVR